MNIMNIKTGKITDVFGIFPSLKYKTFSKLSNSGHSAIDDGLFRYSNNDYKYSDYDKLLLNKGYKIIPAKKYKQVKNKIKTKTKNYDSDFELIANKYSAILRSL